MLQYIYFFYLNRFKKNGRQNDVDGTLEFDNDRCFGRVAAWKEDTIFGIILKDFSRTDIELVLKI